MAISPRPPVNFGPHTRVSFGGRIVFAGLPDEIWNCNVSVCKGNGATGDGQAGVENLETYLDIIAPKLAIWFAAASFVPVSATIDYVKANNILPSGRYAEAVTHERLISATGHHTSNPQLASILAVAVGWRTAISRGAGSRGRVYLPMWAVAPTVPGSMQIMPAAIPSVLTVGMTLLNILTGPAATTDPFNPDPPAGWLAQPVVASQVNASLRRITRVEVGNIIDVQRRRKNAYAEVYSGLTWPA